jgi:pyruvate carboxylase
MKRITKLLVANRSEIAIRVFTSGPRTWHPHGCHVYARGSLRAASLQGRQSLPIGKPGEPDAGAYLDIQSVVTLARRKASTRIHPGYGFM